MAIGQRGLGERGVGVQPGPGLGQAQGIVLLVAHQRDDRAQGRSPARLGIGPLGLGEIGLGLRDPADAQQQPGPQQEIMPIVIPRRDSLRRRRRPREYRRLDRPIMPPAALAETTGPRIDEWRIVQGPFDRLARLHQYASFRALTWTGQRPLPAPDFRTGPGDSTPGPAPRTPRSASTPRPPARTPCLRHPPRPGASRPSASAALG